MNTFIINMRVNFGGFTVATLWRGTLCFWIDNRHTEYYEVHERISKVALIYLIKFTPYFQNAYKNKPRSIDQGSFFLLSSAPPAYRQAGSVNYGSLSALGGKAGEGPAYFNFPIINSANSIPIRSCASSVAAPI